MFDLLLFLGVAVLSGATFFMGWGAGYIAGRLAKKQDPQ